MDMDTLFKQQSKRDLKAARILYSKYNFGNAAFLSQQAIEKAFKYVMMKYELLNKSSVFKESDP